MSADEASSERRILLARIGGAHGIKGEVRAQVFTEDPLTIRNYGPLFTADGRSFEVGHAKPAKSAIILALKGVSDRNAAEALNGTELFVDRECLPDEDLDEGEFFQDDLIGLAARDGEGRDYGSVVAVHDFGAGIVLELQPEKGPSRMIPFLEAAVPELDVEGGWLLVEPIAAGLDDTDEDAKGSGSRRRRPPRKNPEG